MFRIKLQMKDKLHIGKDKDNVGSATYNKAGTGIQSQLPELAERDSSQKRILSSS